jgi:myo-inositol-1(or 4)-monophosphatase
MESELAVLVDAVQKAGARAQQLACEGFAIHTKPDRSPVTTADLEVNRILHEQLSAHFPDDGWLSEESPDDPARLNKTRVWIVDPIDGTKAYINRLPEYCISAALVEQGRPVVAAIFNPSTDEMFSARRGAGLHLNGKPAQAQEPQTSSPVVMVTPRELRQGRWATILETAHCRPMYSIAYALALVAVGRVQATITLEPENEWDLAASVLLIEESGGSMTDRAGHTFRFNQPTPRFHGVIALTRSADQELQTLLRSQIVDAGMTSRER